MTPVVASTLGVVILPLAVVDRDSHLGWVTVVKAFSTSVVLTPPVVLRIVNIRIVIESLVVAI